MKKNTINHIISQAESINMLDKLWIYDDNGRLYQMSSDTSTGYFDSDNEVVMCFSANDNPIRSTMNEEKFVIEWVDYDHITNISLYPTGYDKDYAAFKEQIGAFDFDEEAVDNVLRKFGRTYRAAGYLYNRDGTRDKAGLGPELEVGTGYKPYQPQKDEEEDSEPRITVLTRSSSSESTEDTPAIESSENVTK